MQGFITESELAQADQEFPGIASFFATLVVKPRTFLELVARFDHWSEVLVEQDRLVLDDHEARRAAA